MNQKPKPNTTDDWLDPYFHKYLSPTLIPTGHLSISEEHLEIIKASMHTKLQEVDRAAREDSFIKKLASSPIFEQQLILGGLLYKYLMEDTNATTATITLKNFSRHDKILGNLEIKASLKGGDV